MSNVFKSEYEKTIEAQILESTKNIIDTTYFFTIEEVDNIYKLDVSKGKNFDIEITNSEPKSIVFTNTPIKQGLLLQISIKLNYTNSSTLTHPVGTIWKDGDPIFVVGSTYLLFFTSYNNGITWLASCVGGAW